MAREKESYRDNLERLDKMFPDKDLLTPNDVVAFTGVCRQTVIKLFDFNSKLVGKRKDHYISKAKLARELS